MAKTPTNTDIHLNISTILDSINIKIAGRMGKMEFKPQRTTMSTGATSGFKMRVQTDTVEMRLYEVMDDSPGMMSSAEWFGYCDEPKAEWAMQIEYKDGTDPERILNKFISDEKRRRSRAFERYGEDGKPYIFALCTSLGEAFAILERVVDDHER